MVRGLILGLVIILSLINPAFGDAYQFRVNHSADGIGKFYMGREIAQVMGHQGAGWLERSPRMREEQPDRVIAALKLKPTDVVADIGAGTGFFSLRIAPILQGGKVYGVDTQPEMLEILNYLKEEQQILNVEPVLGTNTSPQLPAHSIDLALLVDAYHEFEYPQEMMQSTIAALKPHGRVALVEYKGENPFVAIKPLHKMTTRQVIREMAAVGLTLKERQDFSQQHLLIFGVSKAGLHGGTD